MKKFFMLTRGRTGSTAVMDSLNKTESITAAQELFIKYKVKNSNDRVSRNNEKAITRYDHWRQKNKGLLAMLSEKILRSDASIVEYLDQLESLVGQKNTRAFGFKVISHHFDQRPGLKACLLERGYSVLYLSRNIPRQVISGMIAKKRGKYNALQKENYQNNQSFVIDLNDYKSRIKAEKKFQEEDLLSLKSEGVDFLSISYEEFLSDTDLLFQKIFNFLDLPAERARQSSYSIMISDLSEVIENYDEIYDCTIAMGMSLD